jgi:uncharacterized protein YlzI (FlbEa/FlbD family)
MKQFLKLTGMDGSRVFVDANGIIAFAATQVKTTMYLSSGQTIDVKESPEVITQRINSSVAQPFPKPTVVGIKL